jgi:hypothetical protein
MNAKRYRRLSRYTGNLLVRDGSAGADPLADLLGAATAPARDREIAGEEEAVAAFRAATHLSLIPKQQSRRRSMSATANLLAVKAILTAVGVTGGGVALAAATGHLPAQLGRSHGAAASASASESARTMPSAATNAASDSASPSPSLRGLCQAYIAQVGSNPGKALSNPAFTALITTAGGKGKVTSYCTSLLAATPASSATAHPTGKASSHPTGKASSHPTGKPTSHPTGKPTDKP